MEAGQLLNEVSAGRVPSFGGQLKVPLDKSKVKKILKNVRKKEIRHFIPLDNPM
jgi:hypothetical protein